MAESGSKRFDPALAAACADGYHGDALDMHIAANNAVVGMRRFGSAINFGTTPGPTLQLTPDQAELIGRSLLAAAHLARLSDG